VLHEVGLDVDVDAANAVYVVKDLVPDMTLFYKQYKSIEPWLQNSNPPAQGMYGILYIPVVPPISPYFPSSYRVSTQPIYSNANKNATGRQIINRLAISPNP
jgi:hypothetical protein